MPKTIFIGVGDAAAACTGQRNDRITPLFVAAAYDRYGTSRPLRNVQTWVRKAEQSGRLIRTLSPSDV
jgi:hypothetical protein